MISEREKGKTELLEGFTATTMKGRKQKKNHDRLEMRNAGFMHPAKNHLNKGSI